MKDEPVVLAPPPTEQTDDLKCGYIVGLKEDSTFVFEVLGKDVGLLDLLGLHEYAKHRVTLLKEMNQSYGPAVLSQQINTLGKALEVIVNVSSDVKDTLDKLNALLQSAAESE